MSEKGSLTDRLRAKLDTSELVRRYGADEPATLAHALSDIADSCARFLNQMLPAILLPETGEDRVGEILLDVEGELRHILYHIHDPMFFRNLEPTHDWIKVDEAKRDSAPSV